MNKVCPGRKLIYSKDTDYAAAHNCKLPNPALLIFIPEYLTCIKILFIFKR